MTLFMLAAYGFICAAVYHLCPAQIRWAVLLLASYGFYASRSLAGLPFILLTTVSTWLAALVIAQIGENGKAQTNAADRERKKAIKAQTRRRQRAAMLAALLLNFGLLAALKYTDDVRGWFGASPLGLLLPLGISFYTFQSIGLSAGCVQRQICAAEKPGAVCAIRLVFSPADSGADRAL